MKKINSLNILVGILICTLCLVQRVSAVQLSQETYQQMLVFRESGLNGDHSQVPTMLERLKEQDNVEVKWTILLALARLGDMKALPDIDALIKYNDVPSEKVIGHPWPFPNHGLAAFAKAARARLLAENGEARTPREKVQRFYQELGRTPKQVNAAMLSYEQRIGPHSGDALRFFGPYECYALRQLADMILCGNYSDYAKLPGVADIDFTLDFRAQEKWKLAQLPVSQRATYLMNFIASQGGGDEIHQQLLMNLGRSNISEKVYAKIEDMLTAPDQYKEGAFRDLLEVLKATGDLTWHQPHPELWERLKPDLRVSLAGITADQGLSFSKRTTFDGGD